MGKVDCHCNTACFGLSALYLPLPTHDPVRLPGITPPLYTKHVLIWSQFVQFSCCPLPFSYLCIFIYLCCLLTLKPVSLHGGKFGNHSDFWQGSQQQQRHEHKNNTNSENFWQSSKQQQRRHELKNNTNSENCKILSK